MEEKNKEGEKRSGTERGGEKGGIERGGKASNEEERKEEKRKRKKRNGEERVTTKEYKTGSNFITIKIYLSLSLPTIESPAYACGGLNIP